MITRIAVLMILLAGSASAQPNLKAHNIVASGTITQGGISVVAVNLCPNGQVPESNGTAWTCASPGGSIVQCTSSVTGTATITIPAGCTQLLLSPASTLSLVGLTHPSSGTQTVQIINLGPGVVYIFNLNGTAASADQWEGGFTGPSGGWPFLAPASWWSTYDSTNSKWLPDIVTQSNPGSVSPYTIAATSNISMGGYAEIYGLQVLIGPGDITFQYSTNGAATGYINDVGYSLGTTQPRSLEIDDGKGTGTAHATASFNGATHHVTLTGTALTTTNLSGCGGSPGISSTSTDSAGWLTEGVTATGCTLTFTTTYTVAPVCVCSGETNTPAAVNVGCHTTATTLVIENASGTGDTVRWICVGVIGSS